MGRGCGRRARRVDGLAPLGTKPAETARWAAAAWRQLRAGELARIPRACLFVLRGGGFGRLRCGCGGCFGGWGRLAGWGRGLPCLAVHSPSDLDRILIGTREWEKCEAPAGSSECSGHGSRVRRFPWCPCRVRGLGGSFPTDRLVSLGCLIAFGFDLCRLIQRFERLGLLEDLRGVRVYGRLDR